MNGNVDYALLYLIYFSEYAIEPKGLVLKQIKFDACISYRNYENGKPYVIVICSIGDNLIIVRLEIIQ